MRRREFFGLAIGSAAFGWPRPTLAQQSGKLPVIAFLGGATPAMRAPWTGAFVDRLKALGVTLPPSLLALADEVIE